MDPSIRDFEFREKLLDLKDAIFGYIGTPGRVKGPLAEMIGELVIEERSVAYQLDRLIAEQEEKA